MEVKPLDPSQIKNVDLVEEFKVPPSRLYEFLTDLQLVKAWTNGNSVLEAKEGGTFSLYNGQITGTFTKLVGFVIITCKNVTFFYLLVLGSG